MRHDIESIAAISDLLVSRFEEILAHDVMDILVP